MLAARRRRPVDGAEDRDADEKYVADAVGPELPDGRRTVLPSPVTFLGLDQGRDRVWCCWRVVRVRWAVLVETGALSSLDPVDRTALPPSSAPSMGSRAD